MQRRPRKHHRLTALAGDFAPTHRAGTAWDPFLIANVGREVANRSLESWDGVLGKPGANTS
jgi:hypothetical protein